MSDAAFDPALPPHRSRRGFRNPPGGHTGRGTPREWLRFLREWGFAPATRKRPRVPAGPVLDEAEALAGLAAHAGTDSATWLGHACFLLRLDGAAVLTDPYLSPRASPFSFAGPQRYAGTGIAPENLPRIDAVAVSHNHYDHLDVPALKALLARNPDLAAITALGCGRLFRRLGFRTVHELDWGGQAVHRGVTFIALPAVHFSSRGLFDRNRTLWCGFGISGVRHSVYFSGDTGWGTVFDAAGERFGPFDLGLVPIAAYDPRPLMQAVHANPEEGLRIGLAMRARTVCAMHWGTIALTTEPAFEPPVRFRAAAESAGLDESGAWLMRIGETRAIPAR